VKTEGRTHRRALQSRFLILAALLGLGACNDASFYTVLGNKIEVPKLAISPTTATVPANGNFTFSASGGVPPYMYSVTSGPGSVVAATGAYTAPASPGVAIVQVMDKEGSTATAIVNPVNYAVTAVSNPGPQLSGGAASGSFTIKNQGSSNGTQTISWTVYASTPTATLGPGSSVIQSGTTGPLTSGGTATIPFAGAWPTPSAPATYYMIASISSPDSSGAILASTSFIIGPAKVDYAVASVSYGVVTTVPGGAVGGTFTLTNNGPNAGTQMVSWEVYASTTNSLTATPAPVLLTSGTTSALPALGTAIIPFTTTWPLTYGTYYLVVKESVQVDQDQNATNDVGATTTPTSVGIFSAAASEPNNNVFSTAPVLGITLVPGMSIEVMGTLSVADPDDFLGFNAGTANSVTFTMSWPTAANVNLSVLAPPTPTVIASASVLGTTSVSLMWTLTPGDLNQVRYINPHNALSAPGNYTMIITAN
jgi:hypothetical protein